MSNRLVSHEPPLTGDLVTHQLQGAGLHRSALRSLDAPALPIHHGLPAVPWNSFFQLPPATTLVPTLRRRRDTMKPAPEHQLARGTRFIAVHLAGLPPTLMDPHRIVRILPREARIFHCSQYRHDSLTLPVYSKLYSSTVRVPRVADTHKRPAPKRPGKAGAGPERPGKASEERGNGDVARPWGPSDVVMTVQS